MPAKKPTTSSKAPAKPTKSKQAKRHPAGQSRAATEKRERAFAHAYIANNRNGLQAALTAGFSERGAGVAANRLLKRANVITILAEAERKAAEAAGISVARTLKELARIAYSDPRKFFNADGSLKTVRELDDDAAAAMASFETDEIITGKSVIGTTKKLKMWDKNTALVNAMKHLGMFEKDNSQRPTVTIKNLSGRQLPVDG